MREKLIELLQSCPTDIMGNRGVGVLADHLISKGVTIPVHCKSCQSYEPSYIRSYCGWCNTWGSSVRESGFCHEGERREENESN